MPARDNLLGRLCQSHPLARWYAPCSHKGWSPVMSQAKETSRELCQVHPTTSPLSLSLTHNLLMKCSRSKDILPQICLEGQGGGRAGWLDLVSPSINSSKFTYHTAVSSVYFKQSAPSHLGRGRIPGFRMVIYHSWQTTINEGLCINLCSVTRTVPTKGTRWNEYTPLIIKLLPVQ